MKDLVFTTMREQNIVRDALLSYREVCSHLVTGIREGDVGEILELVQQHIKDNHVPLMSLEETQEAIRNLDHHLARVGENLVVGGE